MIFDYENNTTPGSGLYSTRNYSAVVNVQYIAIAFSNVTSLSPMNTNWTCCSATGRGTGTASCLDIGMPVVNNQSYTADLKVINQTMISCTMSNSSTSYSINKTDNLPDWNYNIPMFMRVQIYNWNATGWKSLYPKTIYHEGA
jgi:hypothetical protein